MVELNPTIPHQLVAKSLLSLLLFTVCGTAAAVDWTNVAGKDITLFLPGQMSWEWLTLSGRHIGAPMVSAGRNCRMCHNNQETNLGSKIINNKSLEPMPIAGAPATLTVTIKTARDNERLYMQFSWAAQETLNANTNNPAYQHRLSLLLDDGKVKESAQANCWASCHSDSSGMADSPVDSQITKYLNLSRIQPGAVVLPADELSRLHNDGMFLEYWQVDLNQGSNPIVADGYVLESRHLYSDRILDAAAEYRDGRWTVTVNRPLLSADTRRKNIVPGKVYSLGIALHANQANGRYHYVSLPYTLALDQGNADIIAEQ